MLFFLFTGRNLNFFSLSSFQTTKTKNRRSLPNQRSRRSKRTTPSTLRSTCENSGGGAQTFTEITERFLVSIRCKLFYKKESEFKEKGVGTLHLKRTAEGKTQMIVRADTNLGKTPLNSHTISQPVNASQTRRKVHLSKTRK